MFKKVMPLFLNTIGSVHAGSGSDLGIIDLPIQREVHTSYPKLEASTLKGALRASMEPRFMENSDDAKHFRLVFGHEKNVDSNGNSESSARNDTQASAVAFADGKILLFPVRSLKGTFVWITCPFVIQRFNRDQEMLVGNNMPKLEVPEKNTVSSNIALIDHRKSRKLVLEEYTFSEVRETDQTKKLAETLSDVVGGNEEFQFTERIVVLSDEDFKSFVSYSTEVNARIHIDDHGTADNLWYEENIPPETYFYSFLMLGDVRGNGTEGMKTTDDVEGFLQQHLPQYFTLGGGYTIGKGMVQLVKKKAFAV